MWNFFDKLGRRQVSPAVTAGGSWEFIERKTAPGGAGVATIDFDLPPEYTSYMVVGQSLRPVTDDQDLNIRVSNDGGGTFEADGGDYKWRGNNCRSSSVQSSTSDNHISIMATDALGAGLACGDAAGENLAFRGFIFDPYNTSTFCHMTFEGTYSTADVTNSGASFLSAGEYRTAEALQAIRFAFNSGNIESGTILLYGLKEDSGVGRVVQQEPGTWVEIETKTVIAGAGNLDFDLPTGYDMFRITWTGYEPSNDDTIIYGRLSTDGGATFSTAASYVTSMGGSGSEGNTYGDLNFFSGATADSAFMIMGCDDAAFAQGNATDEDGHGVITIYNARIAGKDTKYQAHFCYASSTPRLIYGHSAGWFVGNADHDAFRFEVEAGTIDAGKFVLQGLVS